MRGAYPVVLLPALAAANTVLTTVTLLNIWDPDNTLTVSASESATTTYVHECPDVTVISSVTTATDVTSTDIDVDITATDRETATRTATEVNTETNTETATETVVSTATPTTTARALLPRQDRGEGCAPYELIQGPSTWEFHLTEPNPGQWTIDADCSWEGELTSATLTCSATQNGPDVTSSNSAETFSPNEVTSFGTIAAMTVVLPSVTDTVTSTATEESSGIGNAIAAPTGAMAIVGGAAGLFAAAIL